MSYPILRMSAVAAALLLAGTALAAPQAATGATVAEKPRADRWLALDTNNDGVIDRAEAASRPMLAEHFDRMDRNSDGKLDRSEMHRGHGKHGRGGDRTGAHKAGMAHPGRHGGVGRYLALDTDGDGRISTLEAQSSKLAERFPEVDRNKDGYLVRSELQADRDRRRAEARKKAAERFEQRFTQADGNRDGRLSRAEYEAAWPGKTKMFAFLDEDRDGYVTRADLAPARGR